MKMPLNFSLTALDSGDPDYWTGVDGQEDGPDGALACAIPPEFDGPGGGWSPEDFMGMALANCFIATTRVYFKLSGLTYKTLRVRVDTTIDTENKLPALTAANFTVVMKGASNVSRAERVLGKIKGGCIMINAINCEKTFDITVEQENKEPIKK